MVSSRMIAVAKNQPGVLGKRAAALTRATVSSTSVEDHLRAAQAHEVAALAMVSRFSRRHHENAAARHRLVAEGLVPRYDAREGRWSADQTSSEARKIRELSRADIERDVVHVMTRGASVRRAWFRLGDLPRGMREEMFGLHADGVDPSATEREFASKIVPMRDVDVSRINVSGYSWESVASYDPEKLPPIVVADGKLVDGGHRVAAAQRRGIRVLRAIDLTGMIDPGNTGYVASL